MKHFLLLMFSAAGLLPLGAQPRFEIPFDFKAGGRVMPAGRYEVNRLAAGSVFQLVSRPPGAAAFVTMPLILDDKEMNRGAAQLIFHCTAADCELAGAAAPAWGRVGRRVPGEVSRMVQVGGMP